MTKRNTAAFICVYLVDFIYIKSRLLKTPQTDSIQSAFIGVIVKHLHGIFLPLLIHEFILKKRNVFKIFEKKLLKNSVVNFLRVAEKLFASSFLCSCLIMKVFLFRRDSLIEMKFENLVSRQEQTFLKSFQKSLMETVLAHDFVGDFHPWLPSCCGCLRCY